jgi:hypothetical protein
VGSVGMDEIPGAHRNLHRRPAAFLGEAARFFDALAAAALREVAD